ncbi:MAG: neutral zinc metallopeptidase [Planctomycetes bacterium]|nr:neutral zinc metallopeptidase [Planctomycetota bacterium]
MRWQEGRRSENVEDRRRASVGPVVGGGVGVLVVGLIALFLTGDPSALLRGLAGGGDPGAPAASGAPTSAAEDQLVDFVKVVLGDTEDVWNEQFRRMGKRYEEPKLVVFRGQVRSACGLADAAMGPFYCPGDRQVYIDLAFYDELRRRFRAPGDFAQAYVVAHEVGHHVQNLLGISDRVHEARGKVSQAEYNRLSVRLELQADFLAGVWAHHAQKARGVLESGDLEEAITAANAIGDDTLQRQSRGTVVPDSFTHGTSAQRVAWFRHGFRTGDFAQGNTFDEEQFRRVDPR